MYIHKGQRSAYHISPDLFSDDGRLQFANYKAIRDLVYRINRQRSTEKHIFPGEMRAASLIQEAALLIIEAYEDELGEKLFEKASAHLESRTGKAMLYSVAEEFVDHFPPVSVYMGQVGARQYLQESSHGEQHLHQAIRHAMMLSLANENPANRKQRILFDKTYLGNQQGFDQLLGELEAYVSQLPPFGPDHQDLFTFLRAPFRHAPDDFFAQLDYMLVHWKKYLPAAFFDQLLQGKDLMKEDIILQGGHGGAPPTFAPDYLGKRGEGGMFLGKSGYDATQDAAIDYAESERFTEDIHWMPRVVLIAKNTYVWLDQLSKNYQRDIRRLDQIPDEELDRLAARNFNGLWLIGLWERSTASRKIKHLMGNPDAISSAYALFDYEVAQDLGGDEAYQDLDRRARARGIRLASDMVPNHTGIYSKWVIEHPDYFIQSAAPPFPGYSFTGENLSEDPHVEIRIEDGYYNKTDAAVVFQRVDRRTNDVRYIYHGNDGTMMPWNDTAQLDMLKAEVREAVMQKIFHVARRFSIIRFDAAMTLAKKHFARLWYPRPGTGGDIPSRAEHAMTRQAFDRLFPEEFWREVVDRINEELPETLLLAEAFWFMEGYFVRTLGMHRVYNSAFMHMLKNEENEKYRDLITNTLEFEPEILKRYVNFMSNPDEETAIQQFGTGDKYFGICVMMNTLPGLPMFAHGQVEGFTEKYCMEYQRAYYHEEPNAWLIEKHEKEIFPLTAKRYLFSEVMHFHLYDFLNRDGHVNENVFAFTNRHHQEKALVLFNNKYDQCEGWIKHSAPRLPGDRQSKTLITSTIAHELGLKNDARMYYKVREQTSGMEHLWNGKDIHESGLYHHLQGFAYRVYLDFEELYDVDGRIQELYAQSVGQEVHDLQLALDLQRMQPLHQAFQRVFDMQRVHHFSEQVVRQGMLEKHQQVSQLFRDDFLAFAGQLAGTGLTGIEAEKAFKEFAIRMQGVAEGIHFLKLGDARIQQLLIQLEADSAEDLLLLSPRHSYRENSLILLVFHALGAAGNTSQDADALFFDQLLFSHALDEVLSQTGHSQSDQQKYKVLIRILLRHEKDVFDFHGKPLPRGRTATTLRDDPVIREQKKKLGTMMQDPLVREYLGVNLHDGIWYYSKESFEQLCRWFYAISSFSVFMHGKRDRKGGARASSSTQGGAVRRAIKMLTEVTELSDQSGYQLETLLKNLQEE